MKNSFQTISIFVIVLFINVFSSHVQAQNKMDSVLKIADLVKMKTGSVLLGRLNTGERGKLLFKIVDVGEEEIKMKDIAEIKALSSDFQVDIEDIGRVVGRIDAGDKPGYFKIYNKTDTLMASLEDIILIKRIELKFMERFDGFLGVGYSYTEASGISRFNFNNALIYGTVKYKFFEVCSVILTLGDRNDGVDLINAGLGGLYGFEAKWLALQYFQYQKIPSTGVESRYVSISGGGRRIVHNKIMDLNFLSGITFMKEYGTNGAVSNVQNEVPILMDFKMGIVSSRLELTCFPIFYYSLSVGKRYRFDGRMNLDYEAVSDFTIGIQLLFYTDSKPLSTNDKQNDFNTSVTLGYKF